MDTDLINTPRSRRGLLAAGLGAVAAAVAASVSRITPAAAADGDPVLVGSTNVADNVTAFQTENTWALSGDSTNSRGVNGTSVAGQGVHGESEYSAGVAGVSDSGNGVHGTSRENRGVWGESTYGTGVEGYGVVGVKASSDDGYALQTVTGRVRFDGISGIAVVEAGDTTVTLTPGIPITSGTLVLLTPQTNLGSKTLWYTKDPDKGEVVIHLSGERNGNTKIAYLMLEAAS